MTARAGSPPRYAIYYAPAADSALWRFGSSMIGYDAATGLEPPSPPLAGATPQRWSVITSDPRKYGFHATIKAPFEIAEGRTVDGLMAALAVFASTARPVDGGTLVVAPLTNFIALVAPDAGKPLSDFAQSVVEAFEPFRAPLSEADLARRLATDLSENQRRLLDRYGYPYVGDEFRFHMTLAGPLAEPELTTVADALAARYAADGASGVLRLDRLALFEQSARDQRFRIIASATLGG